MSILTDLASGAAGGILGGVGQLAKDIREAWTGEIPADKRAEFETQMAQINASLLNAQVAINIEEAKSESGFRANWRPFCGWIGGFALGYAAILEPLMTWTARYYGSLVVFPTLDTTITMQILFGMLGLGIQRSYDKKQAPAPVGKE